ncbi:uncharacterized protein LOC119365259 isoform X4 [Triticum dicoccoides]|uniref:uncharacterized protein LOC119365259 isoform X4 n=1 Tax=Triticum dicoccoides TaxID=85692 RepID=UPI00188E8047|nr:uncharacterized protein LOC119365259 isoform X4 [Triticum dicoccoides]
MRRQGRRRHVGIRRDGAQPESSRSPLLTLFSRLTRPGQRIGSRAPAWPRRRCRLDSLAAASSYLRRRRRESAPPLPSGISSRNECSRVGAEGVEQQLSLGSYQVALEADIRSRRLQLLCSPTQELLIVQFKPCSSGKSSFLHFQGQRHSTLLGACLFVSTLPLLNISLDFLCD